MNNYSILIVNEHMQYLFDEAAARRVQHVQKPALRTRIASAVSSVKAAIDAPADYSRSILPTLGDYPYRS